MPVPDRVAPKIICKRAPIAGGGVARPSFVREDVLQSGIIDEGTDWVPDRLCVPVAPRTTITGTFSENTIDKTAVR